MHIIDQTLCTWCGGCSAVCPELAIVVHDHDSRITDACRDCRLCAVFCPVSAISRQENGRRP